MQEPIDTNVSIARFRLKKIGIDTEDMTDDEVKERVKMMAGSITKTMQKIGQVFKQFEIEVKPHIKKFNAEIDRINTPAPPASDTK
jgi:hypothetical protein